MKKNGLAAMMGAVHLIAVLSVLTFGTIYLTLGILALPALTSAFEIGREVIYRRFSVYGSLTKSFIGGVRKHMDMMRFFPLQLIVILQAAGIYAANRTGMTVLTYPLTAGAAFVLTLMIYAAGYRVFCPDRADAVTIAVAMFYKPMYMLAVWVLMILAEVLAGVKLMAAMLIIGAIFLLAAEAVVFLGLTSYKKVRGALTEDDKSSLGEQLLERL